MTPVRLRVGVVGVGRVGSALGAAVLRAGHEVVAATAVSEASVRRAEQYLPGVPLMQSDEVVQASDFVLLTVPDDELRPLVAGLAAVDAWRERQFVAHTSGAQGISVLDPAAARGALAFALHPVMTFAGRPEDVDRLDGVSWGVTAIEELRPVAETFVVDLGGEPVWVPETARPLYHAALTVGSNHLVTLVNDALGLLDVAGVEHSARLLGPLLSAALDNVLRLGDAALTGPVSRGDVATVQRHLDTITADVPDQLPSYVAMALRTAQRAAASGRLKPEQANAITQVLEGA